MKRILDQFKNFSLRSMEGFVSYPTFDQVGGSLRRQLIIYLAFLLALTCFLNITGCARDIEAFPTKTSLTSTSRPPARAPSADQKVITSPDSLPDFTLRTNKIQPGSMTNGAAPSYSGSVKVDTTRLISIDHIVGQETIAAANDLVALAADSKNPIEVYINSPGGSVYAGLVFVQAMQAVKAQGVVIKCYVPNFAASMAYVIFAQCSERYALPYAQLLFHPPRIGGKFLLTPAFAGFLSERLRQVEGLLLSLYVDVMGIDGKSAGWFMLNYNEETLFFAKDLIEQSPKKWFTVVSSMRAK